MSERKGCRQSFVSPLQVEVCPEREGGGAHCFHECGSYSDNFRTWKTERCCHCGKEDKREVRPEPMDSGNYVQPKHGPHAPRTHIRW